MFPTTSSVLFLSLLLGGTISPINPVRPECIRLTGCLPTMTEMTGGARYCETTVDNMIRQTFTAYVRDGEPNEEYKIFYRGEFIVTLTTDGFGNCSCTINGASVVGRRPPLPILRPGDVLTFDGVGMCMN